MLLSAVMCAKPLRHRNVSINIEFTTLVVIGTDCIGSYISNYHTITTTMTPIIVLSEWLLFNANSASLQLYHGESKLIFNEVMMRSALY